jgi:hypothetical protein
MPYGTQRSTATIDNIIWQTGFAPARRAHAHAHAY